MNTHAVPGAARCAARFPLGRVVATPGVLDMLARYGLTAAPFLSRHSLGDWGDVPPDDAAANDRALTNGGRVLSAYQAGDARIWIITESDRSSTCVLLPTEY